MSPPFPTASRTPVLATTVRFWGWLGDKQRTAERLGISEDGAPDATIAATLARFGVAGLDLLVGEFAAAVMCDDGWLLIRDHLGLVPLYYGWDESGQACFDPDIELVRDRCWDGSLHLDVLAVDMAKVGVGPRISTCFGGVFQVPAGHSTILASSRTVKTCRYYRPELVTIRDIPFEHAVDELHTAITDAVQDGLAGVQRVGVHLSGGLDSGVVTALTSRHLNSSGGNLVRAYSWTPEPIPGQPEAPEQRIVRIAAESLQLEPTYARLAALADSWVSKADPLIYQPWHAITYEALAAPDVAQADLEVVMVGWGGDEAASSSGKPSTNWLIRRRQWRRAWAELQARDKRSGRPGWVQFGAESASTRLPWRRRVSLKERMMAPWVQFDADLADYCRARQLVDATRTTREHQEMRLARLAITQRTEQWWKIGHEFGYQYRYPLLDQRVVRCALSLPPTHFRARGVNRRVFRAVAERLLPGEIAQNTVKYEPLRVQQLWQKRPSLETRLVANYPELQEIASTYDDSMSIRQQG